MKGRGGRGWRRGCPGFKNDVTIASATRFSEISLSVRAAGSAAGPGGGAAPAAAAAQPSNPGPTHDSESDRNTLTRQTRQ